MRTRSGADVQKAEDFRGCRLAGCYCLSSSSSLSSSLSPSSSLSSSLFCRREFLDLMDPKGFPLGKGSEGLTKVPKHTFFFASAYP